MAFVRTAISTSGTLTNGSANITSVANTTGIYVGMCLYGVGIQADTVVNSIAGSTITMSKNAAAGGSTVITGQYITQSGTDADPSGLSAMTGVTTITQGSGILRRSVYDLGNNQLRVQGTLTHDPDLFEIITNVQNAVKQESGSTWNFGVARTINSQTSYSKGTGLVFTYNGALASQFGLWINGGTFNWNGGIIKSSAPPLFDGGSWVSNSFNSIWQNSNAALDHQIRCAAIPTWNAITLSGIQFGVLQFLNSGFNAATIKYENTSYQTPGGGGPTRTLSNPIFTGNQATADIKLNQLSGTQTQITQVKNPDRLPVVTRLNNNARGDVQVLESLNLNITNSAGSSAQNVVGYIKDTNNGSRINSSGTPSNNYVNDRTYIASSNSSGLLNLGDILTVAINENPSSATAINYDYRSNFGNNSTDFNIYLGGYEFNNIVTKQSLLGNGGKSVAWTMFDDLNISLNRTNALAKLASSFIVDPVTKTITVTANSTYDDLYDIAKVWKYNGTQTNVETPTISDLIISASGSDLMAYTGWNLVLNSGVTLSEGTKFTKIKFDTVTINGTGAITGVYQNSTGTSTVLTISGFDAGSAVYVEDNSAVQKFYSASATGSVVVYIPPTASGSWYYAVEKYGNQRQSDFFTFSGGQKSIVVKALQDVAITQTTQATVAAYTALETPDKIYDYVAYLRLSVPHISYGQIVSKDGTALDLVDADLLVNQSFGLVAEFDYDAKLLTVKSTSLGTGTTFNLIKTTPPATIEANTNEVISVNIEDANGDSSVTIQGGSGDFTLWKITNATPEDDYATGTNLGNVANITYRFLSNSTHKIVIRDNTTGFRQVVTMEKGNYIKGLFFGDQVQLAQSAEVSEINNKVDVVLVDLDGIEVITKKALTKPQFLALK